MKKILVVLFSIILLSSCINNSQTSSNVSSNTTSNVTNKEISSNSSLINKDTSSSTSINKDVSSSTSSSNSEEIDLPIIDF